MSSSHRDTTLNLVTCCYFNSSDRVQIGRITNIPHWHFEKVILPQQRLIFEAPLNGKLEIHTGMMITAIISDIISCRELQLTSAFPVYSYQ